MPPNCRRSPELAPAIGFIWVTCGRREFEVELASIQGTLQAATGRVLLDLHTSDLLNNLLPSHFDYPSDHDVLVFRRLTAGQTEADLASPGTPLNQPQRRGGPPVLRHIDTSPVGFAVLDKVVLSVHPAGCAVLDHCAQRMLSAPSVTTPHAGARSAGNPLPASPADLMLRVVTQMVDGYLDLRRGLTHQLDDICEDQHSAVLDWIESLPSWEPDDDTAWSCCACAAATCWSRTPRLRYKCIFRPKATAPTTSCARSPC